MPRQLSETPSPQLVFLEDSFADQLIYSMSGHYAFLTDYLSQTSGLLIGHSLNDPTLKQCPGHIIFLIGDSQVMASRAIIRHRDTDAEKLDKQQEMLKSVYGKGEEGVTIVDTQGKNVWQVAKEIARIIHRNKYVEANMQEWLNQIEGGSFDV